MGKRASGSPPLTGASVTFLTGTRGPSVKDGFLDQATKWATAIQKNVGAGAQIGTLGRSAAVATAITTTSATAAKGTLTTATLDAKLGGLRSHTIVFVTHGLDVDKTLPKKDQEDTQGLLLHNMTTGGRTDSDIVLIKMHLDFMKVDGGKVVANAGNPDMKDPDTKKFIDQLNSMVPVVDALRQSVYENVYLAACGTKGRLTEFAKKLAELTNTTVFFNTEAIFVSDSGPIIAEVGEMNGTTFTLSKGSKFFAAASDPKVDLKSGTDTFLPGSMERAP